MCRAQNVEHIVGIAHVEPARQGRGSKRHMADRDVIRQRPANPEAFGLGFKQRTVADQDDWIGYDGGGFERDFRSNAGGLASCDGNEFHTALIFGTL